MNKKRYMEIRNTLLQARVKTSVISHLLMDAALISIGFGALSMIQAPWKFVITALIIPVLMFRSFAFMHEAVHNLAADRPWNDWVGVFYGGLCLLAYEPWKRSHLQHHYWSGNVEKDPVMAFLIIYPKLPKLLKTTLNFGWRTFIPVLGVLQHLVFWGLTLKQLKQGGYREPKLLFSTLWPVLFWTGVLSLAPRPILQFSVIPGLLLYLVWVEIVNLPHHLQLPQSHGQAKTPVWEQHQHSRSCTYPGWIEKWVTLNFNYHTEHHIFPDAPWTQLRQAHFLIKDVLGEKHNIDEKFAWTYSHRKHNLDQVLNVPEVAAQKDVVPYKKAI